MWLNVSAFLALAVYSTGSSAGPTPFDASSPVVDLGYAQYQGIYNTTSNTTNFLSVRYGAPPVGDLRFAAPQPPSYEPGIQMSTSYPSMCYQANQGYNTTSPVPPYGLSGPSKRDTSTMPDQSEDCLFLSVYTPGQLTDTTESNGLPVIVWIHGGGYVFGSSWNYDGADIVQHADYGAVVVVLQYRLAMFGFLAGNEVKAGGALNAGILDQNLVLQWIQEHISKFNGDPSQVTIWGESAGAGSVMQHIVANGGNTQPPLFKNGMTSSTFMPSQYIYNDRIPQLYYNRTVEEAGCSSASDTLACIRAVNSSTMGDINAYLTSTAFYQTYVFVPVVDGEFILERWTETLAKGQVNGDFVLAMGNAHEGNIFVNPNETLDIVDFVANVFPNLDSAGVQEAAYLYRDFGDSLDQAIQVMGETILVCPTYFLLDAFQGRSWKGLFAVPPALHGYDTGYYFNTTPPAYDNDVFITSFSDAFMSLAMYDDVNAKYDPTDITPYWNSYNVGQSEMVFNETEAGAPSVTKTTTDPTLLERCAFWKSVGEMTGQ
ncbi:alpha beta-hydrolase [Coniophora puteana RWD-64-598 SS2]|uniref:Alpha beta-hydrolase n=1 Tax=Coniophora puteana (strain RWD-64-598) TaxID=741705 RepID=A0A5M3MY54_CONPW|nr:alpha beta-hydrolase [Coniophora puteana RWD-64-598 SS2]EIW83561.1 alpha beta-hydrolase [Coniophora puteana RWD-64-598 SS2]